MADIRAEIIDAAGALLGVVANPLITAGAFSPLSAVGLTGIVTSAGAGSLVLKATPGNLFNVYAINLTATPGFLIILNATAAPSDGAVAPLDAVYLPANGAASIDYAGGAPGIYSVGITAVVSSAATPFTKTTGVITAFIKGSVV